ncbi:MAG TPA: NAD(P)H-binding protein [Candidatus Krumholzibacteria bacterium]
MRETEVQRPRELILVAGASGTLGRVITRRLRQEGRNVRALSRDARKLDELAKLGAEPFVGDMLDRASMDRACDGVTEIVSTANSIFGKGAGSPNRVDATMYETLGAAARAAAARRWVHVSARDITADSLVDFFRVKLEVEGIVKRSGVPWVAIRPSALMDVWTGVLFGNPEKPGPVATVFGRGDRVCNFIAIEDVASFVLAILRDPSVKNEVIDIGGPSQMTLVQFSAPIQRALGVPEKRRHIPAPVLRIARHVVRPFNEVAARLVSMGYWMTVTDRQFPEWRTSASRFGIEPITVEQFAGRFSAR